MRVGQTVIAIVPDMPLDLLFEKIKRHILGLNPVTAPDNHALVSNPITKK
jgi:hypothetical protein